LIIVLVDDTATLRSLRLAENVISMVIAFASVAFWANGFGTMRSEMAADLTPPSALDGRVTPLVQHVGDLLDRGLDGRRLEGHEASRERRMRLALRLVHALDLGELLVVVADDLLQLGLRFVLHPAKA
jgi:hypothetical protein